MPHPNVVVFGETGAGKSSLINMFEGGDEAEVSNTAKGVTFASTCYEKTISGSPFKVFDTVGLNEGKAGTVTARAAFEGLHKLIRQLNDGVSLLVYVMRAPRIKVTAHQNYQLFFEVFCKKKVPIVIVITGLEDEENMDQWWDVNKETFDKYKMSFNGFACISATKGKLRGEVHSYEVEYNQSKEKVEKLIYSCHSHVPWKMPTTAWFAATAVRAQAIWSKVQGFQPRALANELHHALQSYGGLSDQEAAAEASKIEGAQREPPGRGPIPAVIVFGEIGAGKSSVLNMLQGGDIASISDKTIRTTFTNKCYEKTIFGSTFRVFDTTGLDEGSVGTVSSREIIEGLYELIRKLDDGVSLLVFVMRAPRINATAQQNYEMFFNVFCDKKVPIVIVVTGLEERVNMDEWWDENKKAFDQYNMSFNGIACITATQGKLTKDGEHLYQIEYEESKKKVEHLIYNTYEHVPWKMPPESWFNTVIVMLHNIFAPLLGLDRKTLANELYCALQTYGGLSHQDAMAEAIKVEKRLKSNDATKVGT